MTERMEVQRTIAADPATIFAVLCDPHGHVAIDSSGMLHRRDGRAGDGRRRHVRHPHGPRGAERLPDGPIRRDRHDHRRSSRTGRSPGRSSVSSTSATSTATRSSRSTRARSSPRTTTGRRSIRCGRRRTSSRSSPRARCGPRSGSWPAPSHRAKRDRPPEPASRPRDVLERCSLPGSSRSQAVPGLVRPGMTVHRDQWG